MCWKEGAIGEEDVFVTRKGGKTHIAMFAVVVLGVVTEKGRCKTMEVA